MSLISYKQFKQSFVKITQLGSGQCATVYLIQHRKSKQKFAYKQIRADNFNEYGQCVVEVELIKELNDEALPKIYFYYFYEYYQVKNGQNINKTKVGMIMELFEKTLGKEILEISKLQMKIYDNNQIWNMMRQLIRIFAKMQRMNILHRDVKPENIMIQIVDDKKNYKIIDLAYAIREGQFSSQNITGTHEYASPKVQSKFLDPDRSVAGINAKDDTFSLGKTFLQVIRLKNIKNKDICHKTFKSLYQAYDPNIVYIIENMLKEREHQRWDFIRVEEQMIKIQNLKKSSNFIMLDDSLIIDEEQEIRMKFQVNSQERKNSTERQFNHKNTDSKPIKQSNTIQTQTDLNILQGSIANMKKKSGLNQNPDETRYFDNENLIINYENQVEKVFFNKCCFKNQINCMKVFKNFILFGMVNTLGVIPLQKDQNSLYMLRPHFLKNSSGKSHEITNILILDKTIVLIFKSTNFCYANTQKLIETVEDMMSNRINEIRQGKLKQINQNNINKEGLDKIKIYEKQISLFFIGSSSAQIQCMNLFNDKFCQMDKPVFIGHVNGVISIFGGDTICRDENGIKQIKSVGGNIIVYSTYNGQLKMLVFKQNSLKNQAAYDRYQYFTGQEIIDFFIPEEYINSRGNLFDNQNSYKVFVQLYTTSKQKTIKIQLSNKLEEIRKQHILRNTQVNSIYQSDYEWNIKRDHNSDETQFNVQIHPVDQSSHSKKKLVYLLTNQGKVINSVNRQILYQFSFNNFNHSLTPKLLYISSQILIATTQQGIVQFLYPENIFKIQKSENNQMIVQSKNKKTAKKQQKNSFLWNQKQKTIKKMERMDSSQDQESSERLYPIMSKSKSNMTIEAQEYKMMPMKLFFNQMDIQQRYRR